MEKVKMSIKESLEEVEVESKLLEEYKSELENLNTEKMAYVEELRQIHTDIDAVRRHCNQLYTFALNLTITE